MRLIVAWIKQQVEAKYLKTIDWIGFQKMLEDVFIKNNVNGEPILTAVTKGHISHF